MSNQTKHEPQNSQQEDERWNKGLSEIGIGVILLITAIGIWCFLAATAPGKQPSSASDRFFLSNTNGNHLLIPRQSYNHYPIVAETILVPVRFGMFFASALANEGNQLVRIVLHSHDLFLAVSWILALVGVAKIISGIYILCSLSKPAPTAPDQP